MTRILSTVLLLIASNLFMTLAWYGHLKFKDFKCLENKGLLFAILISWGIAFFEYCLQVPANRLGHQDHGGPFTVWQLKILQEVISLSVFVVFALFLFKQENFNWNYLISFIFILLAVFFAFKK
jgi:uncharacterized protein